MTADTVGFRPGAVPAAERVVTAYLNHARIGSGRDSVLVPDSLAACEMYGDNDPAFYVADGRVLASRPSEQGAEVLALFVAVGSYGTEGSPAQWTVRRGVWTDTSRWSLRQDSRGRWGVCGHSPNFARLLEWGPRVARFPAALRERDMITAADSVFRAGLHRP